MKKKEDPIDKAMEDVLKFMKGKSPDSLEYTKAVHNLKELSEAKGKKAYRTIDVLAIVVPAITSILGIGMILFREELHPVTSKALAFVIRGGRL